MTVKTFLEEETLSKTYNLLPSLPPYLSQLSSSSAGRKSSLTVSLDITMSQVRSGQLLPEVTSVWSDVDC